MQKLKDSACQKPHLLNYFQAVLLPFLCAQRFAHLRSASQHLHHHCTVAVAWIQMHILCRWHKMAEQHCKRLLVSFFGNQGQACQVALHVCWQTHGCMHGLYISCKCAAGQLGEEALLK